MYVYCTHTHTHIHYPISILILPSLVTILLGVRYRTFSLSFFSAHVLSGTHTHTRTVSIRVNETPTRLQNVFQLFFFHSLFVTKTKTYQPNILMHGANEFLPVDIINTSKLTYVLAYVNRSRLVSRSLLCTLFHAEYLVFNALCC